LLALIRRGQGEQAGSSEGRPNDFVEEQGGIY
jgi:hypothetical protein